MLQKNAPSNLQLNEIEWENIDDSSTPENFAAYLEYMETSNVAREIREKIFELLLPFNGGGWILDAGCGLGSHTRALAKRLGLKGAVFGIDKSKMMIESAKTYSVEEGSAEITFEHGDLYNLPYSDGSFEGAFTDRVFIHLWSPAKALAELNRILKPGGVIVLAETDWTAFTFLPDSPTMRLLKEEKVNSLRNPNFGFMMDEFLKGAGFKLLKRDHIAQELRDFNYSWKMMNLEGAARRLIEKGVIDEQSFDAFVKAMDTAEKKGDVSIHGSMHFGLAIKEKTL